MSKFAEALETYKKQLNDLGISFDEELLHKVTKGLGPSIYLKDASKVSSGDSSELDRVKQNFLIKKLGLEDSPKLDEAISAVVDKLGSSNRNKYRANFYYLLVIELGQEKFYA